jgi:hypothetical protein
MNRMLLLLGSMLTSVLLFISAALADKKDPSVTIVSQHIVLFRGCGQSLLPAIVGCSQFSLAGSLWGDNFLGVGTQPQMTTKFDVTPQVQLHYSVAGQLWYETDFEHRFLLTSALRWQVSEEVSASFGATLVTELSREFAEMEPQLKLTFERVWPQTSGRLALNAELGWPSLGEAGGRDPDVIIGIRFGIPLN